MPAKLPRTGSNTVFLNIPYDARFRRLYLAYVTGLIHLDLIPRATLEIPGGRNRLDKIIDLIRSCRYSIHDLSRVQLDRNRPFSTPRFNMPFELGLAVASARLGAPRHDWFVFETINRRLSKSLSDLNGTDPNIHDGSIEGVMRELGNAFQRSSALERHSVPQMMKTYRAVARRLEEILRATRSHSPFEARVFGLICTAATQAASLQRAGS